MSIQADIEQRLLTLEAVAGKRPGTWSSNAMRNWRTMLAWAEDQPSLDPAWLDSRQNLKLYDSVQRAIMGYMRGNRMVQHRLHQLRNTPEEAFQSIIMGIPLGDGAMRRPLYYELGVQLKGGILRGNKGPEDVRKLAINGAIQKANDELSVSGGRTFRQDDSTDLSGNPGDPDEGAVVQMSEPAQGLNITPGQGSLYEFLGGNKRVITQAVMRAIIEGFQGEDNSPLWQRMVEVWSGRVPELASGKATGRQLEALQELNRVYRETQRSGQKFKLKDVAQGIGTTPRGINGLLRQLGGKITQFLDNPQDIEVLFGTPGLRRELRQVVRVAKLMRRTAAQRVAAKYLDKKRAA